MNHLMEQFPNTELLRPAKSWVDVNNNMLLFEFHTSQISTVILSEVSPNSKTNLDVPRETTPERPSVDVAIPPSYLAFCDQPHTSKDSTEKG